VENSVLFASSVLLLLTLPGPTNTLLGTSGATVGLQRSLPLLLGELSGYLLSILLIQFVLGPAMSKAPATALLLRGAAGAYLMFLSVRLWTTPFLVSRAVISLRQVFVTTLLNPKAFVFALVIIPFGSPRSPVYLAAFAAIVPVIGTLWIAIGALLRRRTPPGYLKMFPRAASVILAIFSATLISSAFVLARP
jgi:threonine/homoserine/homoserine lactone efflux protein